MVTYRCYFMSISVMEIIPLEIILHLFSLLSYLHVWHDGSLNVNYHYSFAHARSYKKWVNFPTMARSFSQCDCIKIKYYIFNRPSWIITIVTMTLIHLSILDSADDWTAKPICYNKVLMNLIQVSTGKQLINIKNKHENNKFNKFKI